MNVENEYTEITETWGAIIDKIKEFRLSAWISRYTGIPDYMMKAKLYHNGKNGFGIKEKVQITNAVKAIRDDLVKACKMHDNTPVFIENDVLFMQKGKDLRIEDITPEKARRRKKYGTPPLPDQAMDDV